MTYSPVVSHSTLRYILHTCALRDYSIKNFDISAAFVNAPMNNDTTFCKLPPAFVAEGKSPYVRLNRALYGLRQSPRLWSRHFSDSLRKLGFTQSAFDPGLYYAMGKSGTPVYCMIYVDDGILVGNDADVEEFRSKILNVFVGRKEPLDWNKRSVGFPLWFIRRSV